MSLGVGVSRGSGPEGPRTTGLVTGPHGEAGSQERSDPRKAPGPSGAVSSTREGVGLLEPLGPHEDAGPSWAGQLGGLGVGQVERLHPPHLLYHFLQSLLRGHRHRSRLFGVCTARSPSVKASPTSSTAFSCADCSSANSTVAIAIDLSCAVTVMVPAGARDYELEASTDMVAAAMTVCANRQTGRESEAGGRPCFIAVKATPSPLSFSGMGIVPSTNPNFFFERKAKRIAFVTLHNYCLYRSLLIGVSLRSVLDYQKTLQSRHLSLFYEHGFLQPHDYLEKKLNATYIISVARKLGCSIFLLPEDIIEVLSDEEDGDASENGRKWSKNEENESY
ncbi:hypothetical protein M9H77_04542 [Catharanthus roseus]|uniref:Uncharacterized protein n=1 Tax=Catharanthus roseus TaxID=4058 RepID=A0ACC0CED7_CATRO|nr:hypothetical protein M9H77_04542 [Catharanthus roseus]